MRMSKQSRLHLPRVPARPGEAPDFSYVQISPPGAVPRPDVTAAARDIENCLAAGRRFTLGKIAKQHAGNAAQLARLLQMHEGAVHLPGFHAAIFEQQNRAVGVEFPGSSQRGFD